MLDRGRRFLPPGARGPPGRDGCVRTCPGERRVALLAVHPGAAPEGCGGPVGAPGLASRRGWRRLSRDAGPGLYLQHSQVAVRGGAAPSCAPAFWVRGSREGCRAGRPAHRAGGAISPGPGPGEGHRMSRCRDPPKPTRPHLCPGVRARPHVAECHCAQTWPGTPQPRLRGRRGDRAARLHCRSSVVGSNALTTNAGQQAIPQEERDAFRGTSRYPVPADVDMASAPTGSANPWDQHRPPRAEGTGPRHRAALGPELRAPSPPPTCSCAGGVGRGHRRLLGTRMQTTRGLSDGCAAGWGPSPGPLSL